LERLKRVIRQALREQAHRIKLQVGTEFEILAQQGIRMMQDGPVIDEAYLDLLFSNLLPHEKQQIERGEVTKGILKIPTVGEVYLIAQPTPPMSLRLYLPPRGQEMFTTDWNRLSQASLQVSGLIYPTRKDPQPSLQAPASDTMPEDLPPAPPIPEPLPEDLFSFKESSHRNSIIPRPPVGSSDSARLPQPAKALIDEPETTKNPDLFQPFNGPRETISTAVPAGLDFNHKVQTVEETDLQKLMDESIVPPPPIALAPAKKFAPTPLYNEDLPWAGDRTAKVISQPPPQELEQKIQFGAIIEGETIEVESEKPIDEILRVMVARRASDIHITCQEPLCFRIDGEIERLDQIPVDPYQMEQFIDPILPPRNRKEFLSINDTDFAYELKGVGRFRVNIFRDKNGVGAVIRHIPSKILTAEELHLPPAITRFCGLTKGLVVVTGPTGSGKSTTLAAMIDLINKTRADHILTIEDPVEFVHPQQKCLVNQREVHRHTTSFARALKAALREDPDIILIGEMRDLETIAIAIETAETGHLVFGTLHTTTAVSTVDRIIDQFPADRQAQIRTMLSSSLKGVVAQTLLKKKGGGRIAAHEILVLNDAVSSMIREGKIHMVANHMQTQKSDGNILLNESLLRLVKEGVIDAEEAIKKSVEKHILVDALRRANLYAQGPSGTGNGHGKPTGGQKNAS
jgi:twitching motility protein PilT